LGLLLYEILTRRRPFESELNSETLRRVLLDPPERPRRIRPDIPLDLEAICLKCLEKQPHGRYSSAALLADDLRRFVAGEPTRARPLSAAQKLLRWSKRRPTAAALIAVSVGSILTIFGVLLWHSSTLSTALDVSDNRRRYAEQMHSLAEQMRINAETSQRATLAHEAVTNEHLYASRMRLAYQTASQGDIEQTETLLAQYDDGSRGSGLRGFEWHYLKKRLHGERLTLRAHGEAYAVAFNSKGTLLATGGEDGAIKFWHPDNGQEVATLSGHSGCVNSLDFSPDGSLLASGSCDRTVRLWDVSTRQELVALPGGGEWVTCVRFSPDGRCLAGGINDGLIAIWEPRSRNLVTKLRTETSVDSLAWTPDGRQLVVGSASGPMTVWETGSWRELASLDLATNAVACYPDSKTVVGTGLRGRLELRDLRSNTRLGIVPPYGMSSFALSTDGRSLATGGHIDRLISLWDIAARRDDGDLDPSLSKQGKPSTPLAPPSGHSPSAPIAPQAPRKVLVGHTREIKEMAFSTDGAALATASMDGTVKIWDVAAPGGSIPLLRCPIKTLPDREAVGLFAMSADLNQLAVCTPSGATDLWDLSNPKSPQCRSLATPAETDALAILPDGSALISPSSNLRTLIVWNARQLQPRSQLKGHSAPILEFKLSADGRTLASLRSDGVIRVQDMLTGQERFVQNVPTGRASPNPDRQVERVPLILSANGRMLLIGGNLPDKAPKLVDLETRQEWQLSLPVDGNTTFSPDGRIFATVIQGPGVALVETATRQTIHTMRLSAPPWVNIAFSPDGRTLATGTSESVVQLWHVATGQEITSFETLPGGLRHLQFSSDGARLAAFVIFPDREEGKLYLWSADPLRR
jgi:WD40 repeat protein